MLEKRKDKKKVVKDIILWVMLFVSKRRTDRCGDQSFPVTNIYNPPDFEIFQIIILILNFKKF